jgi:hypothetical protein
MIRKMRVPDPGPGSKPVFRHCEEPTVRPEVAGPMTSSATKQSSVVAGELDCFASLAMTGAALRYCTRKSRKNDFFSPGGATGLP